MVMPQLTIEESGCGGRGGVCIYNRVGDSDVALFSSGSYGFLTIQIPPTPMAIGLIHGLSSLNSDWRKLIEFQKKYTMALSV